MTLPFNAADIKRNIDHDLSTCTTLLKILQDEQEALKTKDADKVDELLQQKVPLLERLEASMKLRQTWATGANSASTESGWAEMLAQLGNTDVKAEWQQLKTLYGEVRDQNEINGKLLSRHQSTVKRLLDVVRGNTATPNLYTSSGYSSNQAQSNKFGEA